MELGNTPLNIVKYRRLVMNLPVRHTPVVGGVLSTLGNRYQWSKELVMWARVITLATTVLMLWPGFVYLLLIFLKNDL